MLYFTRYVEKWGTGIEAMNTLIKNAGLPEPVYEEIGSSFVVTFKKGMKRGPSTLSGGLNEGLNEGLNAGLKILLDAVRNHPGIQAKDLVLVLKGRPLKTIERQVKALISSQMIERRGSRKTGGYYVTDRK